MNEERGGEMECLFENEKSFLWTQALRIAKQAEDAEDLMQETLMKACKSFATFKRDTNFRAWARKIMLNAHINKVRRKTADTLPLEDTILSVENDNCGAFHAASDFDDPEKVFFHNNISEGVMELFYSLPDEYRTVFSLFHFNGCSYEDISRALNIPVGTVKSRICRARRGLSEKIQEMKLAGVEFH